MDSPLREQLRLNLLYQADAASALGLSTEAYLLGARTQGYLVSEADVIAALQYLADKGFVLPVPKAISPEIPKHRITAAGSDLLAVGRH